MKTLIEQNGVLIIKKLLKVFSCDTCSAKFASDEYEETKPEFESDNIIEKKFFEDTCPTCGSLCIIKEAIDGDN